MDAFNVKMVACDVKCVFRSLAVGYCSRQVKASTMP
jgi:hypothetical protein